VKGWALGFSPEAADALWEGGYTGETLDQIREEEMVRDGL